MNIHLIEPYRSALLALGFEDRLITVENTRGVSREDIVRHSGVLQAGADEVVRDAALQMAVLAEGASIIWSPPTVAKDSGYAYMAMSGFETLGIVRLVTPYVVGDLEDDAYEALARTGDPADLWKARQSGVDAYADLILSQLSARRRPIPWVIFRLLRAQRLRQLDAAAVIASAVPAELEPLAGAIRAEDPQVVQLLDLPIFATLDELESTFDVAQRESRVVAGTAFDTSSNKIAPEPAEAAHELWSVTIAELLSKDIVFPSPASLTDVLALRAHPAIADFRSFLQPLVEAAVRGDVDTVRRARTEVRKAASAFRKFPRTKRIAKWLGYAALPVGVVNVLGGVGLGAAAIGFNRLAETWQHNSSWMYLAGQP